MTKRHVCYIAYSENSDSEARALTALRTGIIDQLLIVHPGDEPGAFAAAKGEFADRMQFLPCAHGSTWVGDALRDVCEHLALQAIPGEFMLITSSSTPNDETATLEQMFIAAKENGITYKNYITYDFGSKPVKFGLFDEVVLKGEVLRDELFPVYWMNLSRNLRLAKDKLFAQHYFFATFQSRYSTHMLYPISDATQSTIIATFSEKIKSTINAFSKKAQNLGNRQISKAKNSVPDWKSINPTESRKINLNGKASMHR